MENIDKHIEETLSSIDNIARAEMPDTLYERILQSVDNQSSKTFSIVPLRRIMLVAALFAGLVIANVIGAINFRNNVKTEGVATIGNTTAKALASAYFNDSSLNY